MEPSLQRSIAERAEQQLSLLTVSQAFDLGMTSKVLRRAIARGTLVEVGTRTLRIGGVPRTFHGDVLAACLDIGAVASHRTAAALHGLAGYRAASIARIEVLVKKDRRRTRSELAMIHRTTNLHQDDVVMVGRIPCVNVARTILGLAALVPEVSKEQLRDVVDTAVRDGLASDRWLWWRLEQLRCRGRNGVAVTESVLQAREGSGRTESWLERELLRCLKRFGAPLPVLQQRIRTKGAFVARVDFAYQAHNLLIEVNGHGSHSTKRQRDADAERVNRLQLAGYRVLQFTYDDVVQRPEMVATTVMAALTAVAA